MKLLKNRLPGLREKLYKLDTTVFTFPMYFDFAFSLRQCARLS